MGLLAVTGSSAFGALAYAAVALKPSQPDVDRPVAPGLWWSAYAIWLHVFGGLVVLGGLFGILTGSIGTDVLLAEMPRRADRKIVYFAYFMAAFYLSLLGHILWRSAPGPSAREREG
jgi:hypothetical protein